MRSSSIEPPAEAFYWDNPEYVLYVVGGALLAGLIISILVTVAARLKK